MIARTCQTSHGRTLALFVLIAVAVGQLACGGATRSTRAARKSAKTTKPKPKPKPAPPAVDDGNTDYRRRDLRPTSLSKTMRERCQKYEPLVRDIATEHGVDPALVLAIVRIESGFRPDARSRVGARGLMQIMPRTGRGMKCADLFDPEDNVRCGVRVLKRYIDRFDGHLVYGIAAYNGGPGYVKDEYAAQRLPRNFTYVEKVLKTQSFFRRHGCEG